MKKYTYIIELDEKLVDEPIFFNNDDIIRELDYQLLYRELSEQFNIKITAVSEYDGCWCPDCMPKVVVYEPVVVYKPNE